MFIMIFLLISPIQYLTSKKCIYWLNELGIIGVYMLHFIVKKQKWMNGLRTREDANRRLACVWRVALILDRG